jgi:hypothetical protein
MSFKSSRENFSKYENCSSSTIILKRYTGVIHIGGQSDDQSNVQTEIQTKAASINCLHEYDVETGFGVIRFDAYYRDSCVTRARHSDLVESVFYHPLERIAPAKSTRMVLIRGTTRVKRAYLLKRTAD